MSTIQQRNRMSYDIMRTTDRNTNNFTNFKKTHKMKSLLFLLALLVGNFCFSQPNNLTKQQKWDFIENMIADSPRCLFNMGVSSHYEIIEDDYETLRIKYLVLTSGYTTRLKKEIILNLNNVEDSKRSIGLVFTEGSSSGIHDPCKYKAYVILNEPTEVKYYKFDKDLKGWLLDARVKEESLLFYFEKEFDRDKFMRYVKSFK